MSTMEICSGGGSVSYTRRYLYELAGLVWSLDYKPRGGANTTDERGISSIDPHQLASKKGL